jgi:predicted ATPase/class 3 adenylate cyclase
MTREGRIYPAEFSSSPLPSGTLTFLFTDLEGSSRLWENHTGQMGRALARHDSLIETAITQANGIVVRPRGEGDSRFAVFQFASEAITAARTIQKCLAVEDWHIPEPLKVRIGIHTGEADFRDGDYYGVTVNRCARIRGLAHGGQTLISRSTFEMVRDSLPEDVEVRDLGEHSLRDLNRSEHVFQLVIAGIQNEFPPIVNPDNLHTNLPAALTRFIGREREINELLRIIPSLRLLTITGAGGAGKTRLALQVGEQLLGSYLDGVWFLDLSPLSNQSLVVEHIFQILGLKEEDGYGIEDSLLHFLRDKNMLLILDNCEHLLPVLAPLVEKILRSAPGIRILATSREPLGVASEIVWWIPSLLTPTLKQALSPDKLLEFEAVRLFVDRAVAVENSFTIDEKNALAIAQICAHLDGIPLAIELAAARVRVLSVSEIAERLDDRFSLLVGPRTANLRQQTLRGLIDWSYELLTENERVFFRRLSIFAGGWSLAAAEEVCSGGDIRKVDILDLLSNLIDKSLVMAEQKDGLRRYRFLETIQQYSKDRLEESGEAREYRFKHADFYLNMADETYGALWGPDQFFYLERLEEEYGNLRKALDWLSQNEACKDMFLQMAGSLWRFWEIRGYISEGRAWLERALDNNKGAPIFLRANALRGAGNLVRQQGDYPLAKAMHDESLALFRELGDKLFIARELDALGEIAHYQGDYERAVEFHTESLAFRHEIGDKEGIAVSLGQLGIIARDHGQYQYAEDLLEESLKLSRELKDKLMTALSLKNLGMIAHTLCRYPRATSLFEESVTLYRELNDKLGISNVLKNLADVEKDQGNFARAKEMYAQCMDLKKEIGDRRGIAFIFASQGEVAFYQGNYPKAEELTEKSLSVFQELGVKRGIILNFGLQAYISLYQGKFDQACSLAREVVAMATEVNAPRPLAYADEIFGLEAYARGDFEEARAYFHKALEVFQKIQDRRNIANLWVNLARTAYRQGEREEAMLYLKDSMALSQELDLVWTHSFALEIMGLLERQAGNYELAVDYFKESLKLSYGQENQQGIANSLGALAGLAILAREPELAACLFAASERIRREMDARMGSQDQQEYEHYLGILKDELGVLKLTSTWSAGSALTMEQILERIENWNLMKEENPH